MQRKTLDEHLGAFLPPLLSGIRLAPKHLQPATFRLCVPLLVAPCMSATLSISDQSVQISVVLPMLQIRRRAEQNPRRDGQSWPTKLIFVLELQRRGEVGRLF